MPKIPTIGHQTEALGPVSQAQATPNLGVAQGLGQVAQVGKDRLNRLQQIEQKKAQRYDAIQRTIIKGELNLWAQSEQDKISREKGFADPRNEQEYRLALQEKVQELRSRFDGSEGGRLILDEELEELRAKYTLDTYNLSTKQQDKLLGEEVDTIVGGLAADAAAAPQYVGDILAQLEAEQQAMGIDLSPEADMKFQEGRSVILGAIIEKQIETGQLEEADKLMQESLFANGLDGDSRRKFTIKIAKGKQETQAAEVEFEQKKRFGEEVFGKSWENMTSAERASSQGLSQIATGAKTPTDRYDEAIAAVEQAQGGVPASPEQRKSILAEIVKGSRVEGGPDFGRGLAGNTLSIINKMTNDALAGKPVDPVQASTVSSAWAMMAEITPDPLRPGKFSRYIPELPDAYVSALKMAGLPVPLNGVVMTDDAYMEYVQKRQEQPPPQVAPPVESPAPEGATMGGETGAEADTQTQAPLSSLPTTPEEHERVIGPVNLAQLAPHVQGLFNSIAGGVYNRTPFDWASRVMGIAGADKKAYARRMADSVNREIVKVLQSSKVYAQTERLEIKEDVDLGAAVFGNETAYNTKLLATYDSLTQIRKDARKVVQDAESLTGRTSGKKAVDAARNDLTLLPALIRKLGIARVNSKEELANVPKGTKVLLPSGRWMWKISPAEGEQ